MRPILPLILAASACLLVGGITSSRVLHAQASNTYSTKFPATEDPVSEGGNWISGGVTLDMTDVRTTPNKAIGTEPGNSPYPYDDSIAALTGSWGNDQAAQATIFVTSTPSSCCVEVELHLRRTIAPHVSTGYEFNCSIVPGNPYMEIIGWAGSTVPNQGTSVAVARRADMGCVNGDVLGATAVGSTLTLYKNWVAVVTGTDSTYSGGAPGIGFFVHNQTGINANYGFINFAANDNGTLPSLNY